jgi:hypothetical protein
LRNRDILVLHSHNRRVVVVFPLGMYSVATHRLFVTQEVGPLQSLSALMAWVAPGAWLATATALITTSVNGFRRFV